MRNSIASTFFNALADFDATDRSRAVDFVMKFNANPANPGVSLERIAGPRVSDLWSARITQAHRAIIYHSGDEYILLYAGKHDDAYDWARRRKIDRHGITGEAQIVVLAESIQENVNWSTSPGVTKLFAAYSDSYLRSIGAPEELVSFVRLIETEDQLLEIVDQLPPEFAENLLKLAAGELVVPPVAAVAQQSSLLVPQSNQRFWVVGDAGELAEVLNKPFELWLRYLHPSQREMVEATHKGAVKVTGAAGTGKTVVAMHRARELARQGKRVLLTTFVTTLCRNIGRSLDILLTPSERKLVTVNTLGSEALAIVRKVSNISAADDTKIEELIKRHAIYAGSLAPAFLQAEWKAVIERQGISSWDEYRDAKRTGRGKPLSIADRKAAWTAFERVLQDLEQQSLLPWFMIHRRAEQYLTEKRVSSPYEGVLVDEAQDCGAPEIRFLAALSSESRHNLMLVGDVGQRVYAGGYSLQKLGIDVRGRSKALRINYRTTRQIQRAAERLRSAIDEDAIEEGAAKSLMSGPEPEFLGFASDRDHDDFLAAEVRRLLADGLAPREIAIFVRTNAGVSTLGKRLQDRGVTTTALDKDTDLSSAEGVLVGTMHRAKGLEFKSVYAANCDRDQLPLRKSLQEASDEAEKKEIHNIERQLLYVALTRARDHATVTWVGEPSPFVEKIRMGAPS